ncbi:Sugar fermentation stimulation protein A [BD1-7 clade bacterium]|uniref:Sugar fermentation stimulation protein homolog n=1 Tax=BD1-7 clade bacterium TaxID=2029982 RepID=A0A5S9N754_9GAMM|nr:Sugar fermentation stimulation protein A [BD1-7 clade bacterium]CAA0084779.1 Sugar fermentation stimulation protein A [BD1-7 clade bacterium]
MQFPTSLNKAQLLKRYKRFLADVETTDGEQFTLHCPNTGAMTGCAEPGFDVWYSLSDNPKRKYPGTWEVAISDAGHAIVVNTQRANQVVQEALTESLIAELAQYPNTRAEVKYGEQNSRIDFLLSGPELPDCYVEVKSVTLLDSGMGYFPDAVSVRGQKHLDELMHCVAEGHRAVLLFCVMHSGINAVAPAAHIDARYAEKLHAAVAAGVEVLAYGCRIDEAGVTIDRPLTLELDHRKSS